MSGDKMVWIDISVILKTGMVHWPGDPQVQVERIADMQRGDKVNLSALSLGSHAGTHMDAPLHFLPAGKSLDEMPFDATIGQARLIEIFDQESVKPEELEMHTICRGERILLKTRNSERCWETDSFVRDFVGISVEAAHFLAERGVMTVGIDYLSVGGYQKNGEEVHRVLLEAGVWIIEGLDLSEVKAGIYELICLPLKILNSDGAPARAALGKRKD